MHLFKQIKSVFQLPRSQSPVSSPPISSPPANPLSSIETDTKKDLVHTRPPKNLNKFFTRSEEEQEIRKLDKIKHNQEYYFVEAQ